MSCRCRVVGIVFSVCVVVAISPRAQAAPFVNLNFEQATVPPGTQFSLSAALAFPGWTPRLNNVVQTFVDYNHFGIGEPAIALYDQPELSLGLPVFEGTYSAALIGDTASVVRASLSQMGDVPIGARSIRFLGNRVNPPGLFVGGTEVPVILLVPAPFGTPSLFGADIDAFAGETVEIRFANPLPPNGVIGGIDAITFSPEPIPEPSVAGMLSALLLLANRQVRILKSRKEQYDSLHPQSLSRRDSPD